MKHNDIQEQAEGRSSYELGSCRVELAKPVLVKRSSSFLWFPSLVKLSNNDVLAKMYIIPDMDLYSFMGSLTWSSDQGRTWSDEQGAVFYGPTGFNDSRGNHIMLPFELYRLSNMEGKGHGAPHNVIPAGKREVRYRSRKATVSGFPYPDESKSPEIGLSGFSLDGQVIDSLEGGYLTTLFGTFVGQRRACNVLAKSSNGLDWEVVSVIAPADCGLPGKDGPTETALLRLKDGRLMCVFRLQSNHPFGQTWSQDEGRTWSEPNRMPEQLFSVEPRALVTAEGAILMVGGRPGIYLWVNKDGCGSSWETIDVRRHHNTVVPDEPIREPQQTTAYTDIIALGGNDYLYIYDRIPCGWNAIPDDSSLTNSVWVVRITVQQFCI